MKNSNTQSPGTPPLHVVHLLRHGQYLADPGRGDGPLTALGRKQARVAGQYLRRWPIRSMWASDLQRAGETAGIVGDAMGVKCFARSALLREIVPTAVPGAKVPLAVRRSSREAAERALVEFFCPTEATRHDLLVCHGNLIRVLVCRVLGAPTTSWLSLATQHCGLTTIVITPGGVRRLVRYSESAYLSDAMLSG